MTQYPIQDFTISIGTTVYTAKIISMTINYTVGSTQMWVPYTLFDINAQPLWNGTASINQAELDAWGTDNMYIVELVCQQAGVTLL